MENDTQNSTGVASDERPSGQVDAGDLTTSECIDRLEVSVDRLKDKLTNLERLVDQVATLVDQRVGRDGGTPNLAI